MTIIINWLRAWWEANICDTFENIHPNYHQQCAVCNNGGDACPTCPFRDKNYNPLAETEEDKEDNDHMSNINWMGTDDVPHPPNGVITFSNGKAYKAYIEAKDRDIQSALEVVVKAIHANDPKQHMAVLKQIHSHLMRALL